jgi:hypothetical protein
VEDSDDIAKLTLPLPSLVKTKNSIHGAIHRHDSLSTSEIIDDKIEDASNGWAQDIH